jgi:hypothetical protein
MVAADEANLSSRLVVVVVVAVEVPTGKHVTVTAEFEMEIQLFRFSKELLFSFLLSSNPDTS